MSERLSDCSGQITVFLSLIFFGMLGIGFLVFGGMREYAKASMVKEAFDLAGEDILAQYDRPLFERYHVFLMDPREETDIIRDGKRSMDNLLSSCGFFTGIDSEISLDSSKKALDDDGKELLGQIKRWETCQGIKKAPEILNGLLKSLEKSSPEETLTGVEEENIAPPVQNTGQTAETEEEKKVRKNWKEWKKVLGSILHSGILLYVIDDQDTISTLSLVSADSLPSGTRWRDRISFRLEDFSITGLSQLKKMCKEGMDYEKNSSLISTDGYLIPYIYECFTHYKKKDKDKEHRLNYEIEYLLGGKTKDKANLKYVADQLFLLRFLVNYGYASGNAEIRSQAEAMAMALTGLLGLPEGKDAVVMLLISSLCCGESLLEVRALFSGEKVALIKTRDNWNLSFSNAVTKLKGRSRIIPVTKGANYQQYLALLLVVRSSSRRLLYRMMDIMQCNVTLEEPEFLMKECIFSFTWTGDHSWTPFYRKLIAFGLTNEGKYSLHLSRSMSYQ
ncbi:MAG: hypothetical protein IKX76_02690 [Eubacterium sp.]|nr:hypothetical protein [Eubacterium sp.]